MRNAVEAYLTEMESRRVSPSRRRQSEYALVLLIGWLEERGITEWRSVTRSHLSAFLVYLQKDYVTIYEENPKWGTRRTWWSCIETFFAWNSRCGRLLSNPAETLKMEKKEERLPAVPNEEEMMRLIEAPDVETAPGLRDRALMEVLYATGIRRGEAHRLDVFDADLGAGVLAIREGKGGRGRVAPLTTNACYWLERYIREARPIIASGKLKSKSRPYAGNAAMWLAVTGRRLSYQWIWALVKRYAKSAGVEATAHTFRHAFATHLLRNGADVRHIQKLLGHEHINTTMIYTHLDVEDLRSAVAGLERLK